MYKIGQLGVITGIDKEIVQLGVITGMDKEI